MLPRHYRFPLRTDLSRLKKKGKIFQAPFFGLIVSSQPVTAAKNPRFAFIVSKKISKKAVQRNRIKRVLSEQIKIFFPRLKSGFDAVFLVKQEIVNKDSSAIGDQMEKILVKAGLLNK